jgi:hypothetical protein
MVRMSCDGLDRMHLHCLFGQVSPFEKAGGMDGGRESLVFHAAAHRPTSFLASAVLRLMHALFIL